MIPGVLGLFLSYFNSDFEIGSWNQDGQLKTKKIRFGLFYELKDQKSNVLLNFIQKRMTRYDTNKQETISRVL